MQRFKATSFRRSVRRNAEATRAGSSPDGELGESLLQGYIPEHAELGTSAPAGSGPQGPLARSGTATSRYSDSARERSVPEKYAPEKPSGPPGVVEADARSAPPMPPNSHTLQHNIHTGQDGQDGPKSPGLCFAPRYTSRRGDFGDPEEQARTPPGDLAALREMLTSSWINLLLVCVPLGLASGILEWGAVTTFTLNFLALVPLALLLGDVTEDLALRFGDVVGGLLNATFGNVVEIILSIAALQKGLYTVVSTSLLGSILSNLLLVLGCCMLFGGFYFKTQHFNEVGNRTCSALLFLSCIGIILPTGAAHMIHEVSDAEILAISRGTCVILLICYICYLAFQLHTHREMFSPAGEEESEQPILSLATSMLALTAITAIVSVSSEFLTGSLEEVSKRTNLGEAFLGMIVLPIAGNACEHLTAITVAMKNKMDLALGVAVGSSIQIALFAVPLSVVVAWIQDIPFSLNFDTFSTFALTLSVVHANNITNDAMSHWLLGVQLVAVYVIIAVTYLYRV